MPSFRQLGLIEPLCRVVDGVYRTPSAVQQQAIPPLLDGRDVLVVAPLGAGKTAAYLLPLLQRLAEPPIVADGYAPRAIVLTALRERAESIGRALGGFGQFVPVRHVAAADSSSWSKQSKELRSGVEVIVTTPRQLVQLMREGALMLHSVEIAIVDDVDEILEAGMGNELDRIEAELPRRRQAAFFVATADQMLQNYARDWLQQPMHIEGPALSPQPAARGRGGKTTLDLPDWLDNDNPIIDLPTWLDEKPAPKRPAPKKPAVAAAIGPAAPPPAKATPAPPKAGKKQSRPGAKSPAAAARVKGGRGVPKKRT